VISDDFERLPATRVPEPTGPLAVLSVLLLSLSLAICAKAGMVNSAVQTHSAVKTTRAAMRERRVDMAISIALDACAQTAAHDSGSGR
jgi:hypothetical protein